VDSFRSKALTAKHAASLRLLCIVGGNLAKLNARSESAIRLRSACQKSFKPARSKVLAARYNYYIQLVAIKRDWTRVKISPSDHKARLQIRYAHPISLHCHQLHIVIVAKPYSWLQEPSRSAFPRSVVIFVKYREVSTRTILQNFIGNCRDSVVFAATMEA